MTTPTPGPMPEDPQGQPPTPPPSQQPPSQQPPSQPPSFPAGDPAASPASYPSGQPPTQSPGSGQSVQSPDEDRLWAGAAHWGAIIAAFVGGLALLAPLIVLLAKGNSSPFIRRHAVESLNFQISALIYAIVSLVLVLVLVGFLLLIALGILWLVCVILASLKASNGQDYRYPLSIRFIS